MKSKLFWTALILLVVIPQLSFWLIKASYYHFDTAKIFPLFDIRFDIFNFVWMAFPQIALALMTFLPKYRNLQLLFWLMLMGFVVAIFQHYVFYNVPRREGALFWVLFLPIGIFEIFVASILLVKTNQI